MTMKFFKYAQLGAWNKPLIKGTSHCCYATIKFSIVTQPSGICWIRPDLLERKNRVPFC